MGAIIFIVRMKGTKLSWFPQFFLIVSAFLFTLEIPLRWPFAVGVLICQRQGPPQSQPVLSVPALLKKWGKPSCSQGKKIIILFVDIEHFPNWLCCQLISSNPFCLVRCTLECASFSPILIGVVQIPGMNLSSPASQTGLLQWFHALPSSHTVPP